MTESKRTIQKLDGDGLEIDYLETGNGDPIIVFPSKDDDLPDPVLKRIAESYRIVSPKLSSRDGLTPSQLAEKLPRALTHLIPKQWTTIGISAGASAAISLAIAAPELVHKLVLLSPLLSELPDLTAVKAATLVLIGTRDASAAIEVGRLCREKISSCHLSFIYGAGHRLTVDRPQACLDPILQFLQEGEQFIIFRESQIIRP